MTVVILIASGCSDATRNGAVVTRDSAGIRIVEVPASPSRGRTAADGSFHLTAEPELTIGVVDGDEAYTFGRITGVDATPDGRIVVLDAQQLLLRVYSPDGSALARMGGRGSGPAEFLTMGELWLHGDTIIVHDGRNRKVVRFTADGLFLDSRPVGTGARAPLFGQYRMIGEDGFVVTSWTGCSMPRRPENIDNRWVAVITEADGNIIDTLQVRMISSALPVYGEDFCTAYGIPFGRNVMLAASADGRWAMGDGERYEVSVFRIRSAAEPGTAETDGGDRGRLHDWMLIRRDYSVHPVSDGELKSFRDTTLSRIKDDGVRSATARALDDFQFPRSWPAYSTLRFDDAGRLWVLRTVPRLPGNEGPAFNTWDVYAPDGQLVHEVQLPREIGVRSIRGNLIYGTTVDDLGVNFVRRWRLVPADDPDRA